MGPSTSDKGQKKASSTVKSWFKKFGRSLEESAQLSKSPDAVEERPSMLEPGPAEKGGQINATASTSNGQTQNSKASESTWDRASELLRERRPDLYADLEDLRAAKDFRDRSVELQGMLAERKGMRDDAHRRSRMNVEKVLRSILVYKDVALAVSRLDPHGIAPMILTGVCVVAQAALNGLQHHEEVTATVGTIAARVAYWTNYERRALILQDKALRNEIAALKESLADLYATILEIQLGLTRYCDKSIFRRVAGAAYRLDILRNEVTSMENKDDSCQKYKATVDIEVVFQKQNADILQWISPTDPMLMHGSVVDRTKIGTKYTNCGEWLLEEPKFRNWDNENSKDQVLWLYGTVGTGKTTLIGKVIDWHLSRSSLYTESPFAFYYCSDSSGQRSSDSTTILRSFVRQLCWCAASTTVSEPVQQIYERLKRDRPKDGLLSYDECEKILKEIFEHGTGARIFIDALDECDDPEKVLDVLGSVSAIGKGTVKIFATSRTEVLRLAKGEFPDACFLELDELSTRVDMETYIQREVRERKPYLRLLRGERPDLEDRLIELLSQRAGGMFRWVELQLSLFLDQKRPLRLPRDVERRLERLEKVTIAGRAELDKTYSQILDRNTNEDSPDRQNARAAYSVILYACRQLTFEELAVAVRWHNDSDEDAESVTPDYVADICRDCLKKSTSEVAEFAHVSVKEFLLDKKDGDDLEYSPVQGHELLAKLCFNHLLRVCRSQASSEEEISAEEETSPKERRSLDEDSRVLENYTRLYWPNHLGFVDSQISEGLRSKLWQFLLEDSAPSPTYVKWADDLMLEYRSGVALLLLREGDNGDRLHRRLLSAASSPPTPLAALCAFGFISLIPLLNVFNLFDWNRRQILYEEEGKTLLYVAAEEGHQVVVELLLAKTEIDINAEGGEYGTALQAASSEGNEKVVQLLLDKGADVNVEGGEYGTALQAASSEGNEKVVQLLLDKGADVNAEGGEYGTALQAASLKGNEKVVQLLLDKGADVNAEGGEYGTALQAASLKGNKKVVQLLLDKGAIVS